jgi:uncharacterized coiled-coil DUF342 family protein
MTKRRISEIAVEMAQAADDLKAEIKALSTEVNNLRALKAELLPEVTALSAKKAAAEKFIKQTRPQFLDLAEHMERALVLSYPEAT